MPYRFSDLTRFRLEHVDLLFDRVNDNEPPHCRPDTASRPLHLPVSSTRGCDMATVENREILRCSCCGLTALKQEWSCGCTTVEYDEDATACGDCDNFRDQREYCGKSGWPGERHS